MDLLSRKHGLLEDAIVGAVGAVVGGFVFVELTGAPIMQVNPIDIGAAIAGAMLFIALSRGLTQGRSTI